MKKKVAAVATPAPVAVAKPKVAPKRAVKPSPELGKALKAIAAIPATANRAQRRKVPAVAQIEKTFHPVKKTTTASLTGSLSAIQQARSVLMNARGIGEAIDTLNRLEAQAREQLVTAVNDELKTRRIKADAFNIGTESKPDGVYIVLTKK